MKLRSRKAACYIGAAIIFMSVPVLPAVANTTIGTKKSTDTEVMVASYASHVSEAETVEYKADGAFYNKALAVTSPYLDVFNEANESSEITGRLFENTVVNTIDVGFYWTKIQSGNCVGYVSTNKLLFAEEAECYLGLIEGEELHDGYTMEEVIAKEAAEEAARIAEEERRAAEAEAARIAAEKEAARRQAIIENTISGTDFTYNPTMEVSDEEIWLLACVIDWESAWQPYEGKLAVANVVLNRVRSSRYPNSIEGVIYQRSQFSGVSNGNGEASATFSQRIANGPRNTECMEAALEALSGVNNVGIYTGFRQVAIVDLDDYDDFVIIGDHIFH